MSREPITLAALLGMGSANAAALLIVRRNADDYDGEDEAVFDEWLAADPAHPDAWARACNVCAHFDFADDEPLLSDLREALRRQTGT